MAETSKIDRYAAPNETTTISPVQIEVSFLLWNYCQPQDLDELVRNDPWSDAMKSFKSRFSFGDIFNPISPWLDKTIGIGLRSDQIEPVKTFKELKRLLNGPDISENVAGLDIIGLDDDFGNMSAFIDDLFPVHFIHIFQIKEGEIKEPVILEYRSAKDWTAVFPNGSISRSEGDYFSISTSTKAFVLPLPYRMTDEAITMTVDMFSQSIHNPDVKGGCESFRIEFNSDWLKNNGALKRHETGGIGLWSIPLFSPFHIAIKMSHLLKDRLKWVGITDLKQKSSELSIKEQEVHYRAIYSGIMKQLYDQDKDLKDELNKGFLEFEYHRYNLSFRIACSRLARSVEYLLNSWMVLQLEKTNRIDEELRTNGNAWVDLFRILSDALNGHPTGTIPYQYRREIHGEYRENNEFYSPIVAWMEKMIDKRLVHKKGGVDEWGVSEDDPLLSGVMNTEEKTLWDRSGEVKDALGKYDAIFDMYVSIRVFDLWEEGESLRKWHKRLSESADRFQENLGIFYKVRKISDTVGKGIGYANYCHNLLDGKHTVDDLKGTLDIIVDLMGTPERELQKRMFFAKLSLQIITRTFDVVEYSDKALERFRRSDYNAMIGAGMVVASSAIWIGCAIALKAAPAGPIGWIIGAVALVGSIIYMYATDTLQETFSKICAYTSDQGFRAELPEYCQPYDGNWPYYKGIENSEDTIKIYREQLRALMAIFYNVPDEPEFEINESFTYSGSLPTGFRLTWEMPANPKEIGVYVSLTFRNKSNGEIYMTFYVDLMGADKIPQHVKVWLSPRNSRSPVEPELNSVECRIAQKRSDKKWKVVLYSYCNNFKEFIKNYEFHQGFVKIYIGADREFYCPNGGRVFGIDMSDQYPKLSVSNPYHIVSHGKLLNYKT